MLNQARIFAIVGILIGGLLPSVSWGERPSAPRLLPEETLVMVRVNDVQELRTRFKETTGGKLVNDPEIAPFVSKVYASLGEWFKEIEDRVGLPLDQLLSIPQGEFCLALVPQPDARPALVVLMDVHDKMRDAQRLLEKGEAYVTEQGGTKTIEVIAETRCQVFNGRNGRRQLVQFDKDGTLVMATSIPAAEAILAAWRGGDGKRLGDNERFGAIMNRCRGAKDDPAPVTWYVDPINVARNVARGNVALNFIPILGLDGIQGIGGSLIFDSGEFDTVGHIHLLLSNPRSGILELATLASGDSQPEPWVPADAASYTTLHWDLNTMYRRGAKIYNGLTAEGAFEQEVKDRVKQFVELDFETELLPQLAGRVTSFNWVQKPYKLNSQAAVIGVKLNDAKDFGPSLEKMLTKIPEGTEKGTFAGVTYHRVKFVPPARRGNGLPDDLVRAPNPCIGIVGDYLLFSDSEDAFQHALAAQNAAEKQLATQLDFKLIAGKIRRQSGGDKPGLVSFLRPEESMRMLYEVARSESAKSQLDRATENGNRGLGILKSALEEHPLPPFGVLEKYIAPGGSVLTNDETGFHYMLFQLKRK